LPESRRPPFRVVQYGLGPIGLECVRTLLAQRPAGIVELVGAIDVDPGKVGRDVVELAGGGARTGIVVRADAEQALREWRPDVVLHTTRSSLEEVHGQIELCLGAGAHVVSSSEELVFPFERHPALSARLDELARRHGLVVLGTGVNPGYVMDVLPLVATGVCREVTRIEVERVVDASRRRPPLQRKIGAGLTLEAFAERRAAGSLGHVGLRESLLLVADGLGWKLERVEESLDPVVAVRRVDTGVVVVEPGQAAGVHQLARGYRDGREVLRLELQMYVGAPDPHDAVRVDGDPPIDLWIRGGVFGDTATVGALVNAIPLVARAAPGLRTVQDLELPRALGKVPPAAQRRQGRPR
jgi:4-hydroxy-tetrahydrodipicolinate reductase